MYSREYIFSGITQGAAVLIEKKLQKELLYFPCRHHIHEILLKSVFEIYSEKTTGPNVPLFSEFQKSWNGIDQSKYIVGVKDKAMAKVLKSDKDELINFISDQFKV